MTARSYAALALLVAVIALASAGALFAVQNAARKVQLSFELPFHLAKWQLAQPMPVLWLIGGAFVLGFVLAMVIFGVRSMRLSRRVRKLEQEIALGGAYAGRTGAAEKRETPEWR